MRNWLSAIRDTRCASTAVQSAMETPVKPREGNGYVLERRLSGMRFAGCLKMSVQSGVATLDAIEQSPEPAVAQWRAVSCCPSCGSELRATQSRLPDHCYPFGAERIAFPEQGIAVIECDDCGLFYKSAVPSPALLAEIFRRHAQAKWAISHDYLHEVELLRELNGNRRFDLLDIGAANGELLSACGGVDGRRSALDVMRYTGIDRYLSGEFIEGFLDNPLPEWSHEPYDVVTLFDVIEHLYDPGIAFENLRALLRTGGLAFIETGNSASFWPRRIGINHWWYVRLLEHHVFWSRRSLERIATAHGFRAVYWREVRHKSRRQLLPPGTVIGLLKTGLYLAAGRHYTALAHRFGREGAQPCFPFATDHFQACLMKI